MGLSNLKSRFDRHKIQEEVISPAELSGQTVGGDHLPDGSVDPTQGPNPATGDYFRGPGRQAQLDSPFVLGEERGPKMDQMVKLMTEKVTSNNHHYKTTNGEVGTIIYDPSPKIEGHFADLNGTYPLPDVLLGQFGGPYEGNFPG